MNWQSPSIARAVRGGCYDVHSGPGSFRKSTDLDAWLRFNFLSFRLIRRCS